MNNSLPAFTCVNSNKTDLWPDIPAMGYGESNKVGRDRAADLIEVIRRTQSPVLLGHVIEAIVARGVYGGMEVGFFHALSIELLNCRQIREFVEIPVGIVPPPRTRAPNLRVVSG